jgi:hypothetical protein
MPLHTLNLGGNTDTSALERAIAQLEANEVLDDQVVAGLAEALLNIPIYDDTPLQARITALEEQDWIRPIYDPTVTPTALTVYSAGATAAGTDGTRFVNEGRTHQLAEVAGAVIRGAWEATATVPTNHELRFAVRDGDQGTIRVKINGGNDTLMDGSLGWQLLTNTGGYTTRHTDGPWVWFAIAPGTESSIRITIPLGVVGVPCIYAPEATSTEQSPTVSAMELIAPDGASMIYRPVTAPDLSSYALKTEIPATPDLTPYAKKTEVDAADRILRLDTDANTEAIVNLMDADNSVTPILSNMGVNKTLATSYWPNKTGMTRTGGVSRPPNTVSDFYMGDANYDAELELPISSKAGLVLSIRNEATLAFTLRSLNTDLASNVNIPTSRSIHFVSDFEGRWHWILAAFATK